MKILDIGGGFPAPYDKHVRPFRELAKTINAELNRLFPKDMEILAEPGRFLVATAATAVAGVIGKAVRDGKQCYYINDGVYHTFSGVIFDHIQYHFKAFKRGADASLLGLRSDVRCARHDFAGRGTARLGTRRLGLQREHRRLHARLVDVSSTASRRPRSCTSIASARPQTFAIRSNS